MAPKEIELITALVERRDELRQWLMAEAPQAAREQAHLDGGSSEQAYWTHGYQAALDDIIRLVSSPRAAGTAGRSIH